MRPRAPLALALPLAAIALVLTSLAASAASTPWQDLGGARARLVATLDPADSKVTAVIEVAMKPGWKTYWREPGSAGIPPEVSLARSIGFAPGTLRLPVPEVTLSAHEDFIGWHGRVLQVIDTALEGEPARATLRVDWLAGLCETICIPAQAQFELEGSALLRSDAGDAALVAEALAALPGEPAPDLRVDTVTLEGQTLVAEASLGREGALVAEAPGWTLRPARAAPDGTGRARFALDVLRRPKDGSPLPPVRLTLMSGGRASEQTLAPR